MSDDLAEKLKLSLRKIKADSQALIDAEPKSACACELLLRSLLEVINTMTITFTHKKTRAELDGVKRGMARNGTRFQVCPYIYAHLLLSFLSDAFRALDALWTTNGSCQECFDLSAMSYTLELCDPKSQSTTGGGTLFTTPLDAKNYHGLDAHAKELVKPVAVSQLERIRHLIQVNPPAS